MPRKKALDQSKLLNRSIFIRMTEKDIKAWKRLYAKAIADPSVKRREKFFSKTESLTFIKTFQ